MGLQKSLFSNNARSQRNIIKNKKVADFRESDSWVASKDDDEEDEERKIIADI